MNHCEVFLATPLDHVNLAQDPPIALPNFGQNFVGTAILRGTCEMFSAVVVVRRLDFPKNDAAQHPNMAVHFPSATGRGHAPARCIFRLGPSAINLNMTVPTLGSLLIWQSSPAILTLSNQLRPHKNIRCVTSFGCRVFSNAYEP